MKIFALADTHLSLAQPKPMDIFGNEWRNHHKKIADNWYSLVNECDWVLVGGDISWAMSLSDADIDLRFLGELPGKKVLIRGNHDYWWKSISKVRRVLPENMYAIQNDYIAIGNIAVCGTRGWNLPDVQAKPDDVKIYNRELIRAEMSLKTADQDGYGNKLFIFHYPPFYQGKLDNEIGALFKKYGVKWCVYGHLHGSDHSFAVEGTVAGVEYKFVAADYIDFAPVAIVENV